jgi:hypothetical protein
LLITESTDEFNSIRQKIEDEIKPCRIIEQIFVEDFTDIVWETRRLRRCRDAMMNASFRTSLEKVLTELLREPGESALESAFGRRAEVEDLALRWFTDPDARKEVMELLGQFHLDESAIEAQAMRKCFSDLERLDRRLSLLESRRRQVLLEIEAYRATLAERMRQVAEEIETKNVLRLEDASKTSTAA